MHPCFFNKRKQNYAYKKRQKFNSLSVLGMNLLPPSVLSIVLFIKKKKKKLLWVLAQVVRIVPLSSWLLSSVPGAQPSPAPIVPYPLQNKPRGVTRSPTPFKSRFTPSNGKVGGNPGLWNKNGKDGDAVRLGNSFCACVRSGCSPNCLQLASTDANQSVKAGLHPFPKAVAALLLSPLSGDPGRLMIGLSATIAKLCGEKLRVFACKRSHTLSQSAPALS